MYRIAIKMYLHIGSEKIVVCDEILGIFDLDNTTVSKITRESLKKSEKNGSVVTLGYDLPKSYVICCPKKGKAVTYISPITTATLTKRTHRGNL